MSSQGKKNHHHLLGLRTIETLNTKLPQCISENKLNTSVLFDQLAPLTCSAAGEGFSLQCVSHVKAPILTDWVFLLPWSEGGDLLFCHCLAEASGTVPLSTQRKGIYHFEIPKTAAELYSRNRCLGLLFNLLLFELTESFIFIFKE